MTKFKTNEQLIKEYFADLGEDFGYSDDAVVSVEHLSGGRRSGQNYRISFKDGTVSDWQVYFDEEDITDAICFNEVI